VFAMLVIIVISIVMSTLPVKKKTITKVETIIVIRYVMVLTQERLV